MRVHTDDDAADIARSMSARTFTTGGDIVFGSGEFTPHTDRGLELIGHGLSHVLQQRSSSLDVHLRAKEEKAETKTDVLFRIGFFLTNPIFETGAIQIELKELNTSYAPQVNLDEVIMRSE